VIRYSLDMKTRVYELVDEVILTALFSEGAPIRKMSGVPKDHGELIWEGEMDVHPIPGTDDLLTLDGEEDTKAEYLVLLRLFDGDDNTCTLLVCEPPYDEGVVS
jgi:hypothetical protein